MKSVHWAQCLLTIRVLLRWYLIFILVFTAGRVVLVALYFDRLVGDAGAVWPVFLHGLRMDTIAASLLLLPPALLLHLTPRPLAAFSSALLRAWFFVALLVVVYMENATLPFIAEYDVRPNVIFINYLKYPREVLGTIWAVYKPQLLVAVVMMALAAWWFARSPYTRFSEALRLSWRIRLLLLLPVLMVLLLGVRSSLGHRPANPSDAVFSANRLLNELAKNSLHSVAYAAYSQIRHGGSADKYGRMPVAEAVARVRARLKIEAGNDALPFLRREATHFPRPTPKNLVIFLQESLGAQFVAALGGEPGITPNINRLSKESVFFTQLFSNGTRSIRGIAAVVSGFLATPGKGVVKRNLSQQGFFTVASLLKPLNYRSSFFYGGESRFDNMKSWFVGNGFDEIYDEETFDDTVFHGTWGVDDASVVDRADRYYRRLHANGEKFVSVIFSTTNHTPFDFPPGRIELVEGVPEKSVKNAIRYADYAIGMLIDRAREAGYYDDTVFLVIADHNIRVYGDDVIPVDMFHIPGMILGGGIAPRRIDTLSSQPDALATALDLLGVDLSYPVLGRSAFNDDKAAVTLLQYHDIYGLRQGEEIAVLQPGKAAQTFQVTPAMKLRPTSRNAALEKDALAFVTALDWLYREQRHRLPRPASAQ